MKVLVVSPHPDDETLGACGTILKLISQGAEAVWLNVTNMKAEYGYCAQSVSERKKTMERVKAETGYAAFYDLGLRPAGLTEYAEADIISQMKAVFDRVEPELLFLPYLGDAHSDHRVVYDCALACAKAFRAPYIRKILCMEIISETNYAVVPFRADCYVDITPFMEKKLEIAALYQSEILPPPFPRSKEGLFAQARYRGAACFREYAEAFQIVKEIIV